MRGKDQTRNSLTIRFDFVLSIKATCDSVHKFSKMFDANLFIVKLLLDMRENIFFLSDTIRRLIAGKKMEE